MSNRVRPPASVRIDLSHDDWIIVKKHLSAGEHRAMMTRLVLTMEAGEVPRLDPKQAGLTQVLEYLLDWSFLNYDGTPLVIRDRSEQERIAALGAIEQDAYAEVLATVNAHIEAMALERLAEKNVPTGAPASPVI